MANKRMFSLSVIDSDVFLDLSMSAQALYFHLNMRADDDGFVNNPRRIQRLIGAANDDLNLLIAKGFVLTFESGVIVIKHWRMHNTLSIGRYNETSYLEEKSLLRIKENKAYSFNDGELLNDEHLIEMSKRQNTKSADESRRTIDEQKTNTDKNREEEIRIDKSREEETINYSSVVDLYRRLCPSFPKLTTLSDARKKAIKARLKQYTLEDFETLFTKAEASKFLKGGNDRNWSATFDWLIKDSNMAKVLDGNYDNTEAAPKANNNTPNINRKDVDWDAMEKRLFGL